MYFATDPQHSHRYAKANSLGECCMFIAKVLIGNSILGSTRMKVCPTGYNSTTNGKDIYAIYHDAQAYAQYLIIYR